MASTSAPAAHSGIGVKDLLEAGLHFGHQTKRWNPKMKRYIFGKRNGIHIIDLAQSLGKLEEALAFVYDTVVAGQRMLFVGTKKQAQQIVREVAEKTGQPFVTHRWLGGTLTNSQTIRSRIKRMHDLANLQEKDGMASIPKKEASGLRRELAKLQRNLGGIGNMVEKPGALFVVDINREAIAVAEARKLNIPVVAIVDTNCDPDPITHVIPGNDDAIRAIRLLVNTVGETVTKAGAEYARIAAELAKKREAEEAEARKAAEKAEAARAAAKEKKKAAEEGKEPKPAAKPRARKTAKATAEAAPEATAKATAEAAAKAPVEATAETPAEETAKKSAAESPAAESAADAPATETSPAATPENNG